MSVGNVCNREVICIEKEASILKASQLMRQYHVGDLVVTEKHGEKMVPIAMLTDRDIVIEVLAKEVDFDAITVKDVMSQFLLMVDEKESVLDVVQKMYDHGVRRVPIINKWEALVGIFTVDDLIDLMAEQLTNVAHLISKEQQRERTLRS